MIDNHMYRLLLLLLALPALAASPPNILFLLSDDQGWDGTSVQLAPDILASKSNFYETPNLERFAEQGMRFSAAYAPSPSCSPTRISLQTGRTPAELHWTKTAPNVNAADGFQLIEPRSRKSISDEETTIGEVMNTAGYITAHFGKWHIGGGGPARHGYDHSDGETGNLDAEPFVDPNPVDIFGMGERALDVMRAAQENHRPFFIQMSYNALHYPMNARAKSKARFAANPANRQGGPDRRAITWDLDDGFGQLIQGLDDLGLTDTTYVIYMSDNGASGSRSGPLQGGKGSAMESGIRVPMLVRGPGIPANSHCGEIVVGTDWFPTFATWAGVTNLPPGLAGGDLAHLLRGELAPVQRANPPLFHVPHYQGDVPRSALLSGSFKLLRNWETKEDALYNVNTDPGERSNLAAQHPDITAELGKEMDRLLTLYKADLPTNNPHFDPNNVPDLNAGNKRKGGRPGGRGPGRPSR